MVRHTLRLCAALLLAGAAPATAEIAISANDGKQVRAGDAVPGPFPDTIATIEFGLGAPRVVGQVAAPATLNGPPVSVAVSRRGGFALVASSQKFGADGKLVPYGIVSLIDVRRPAAPLVVASLETCAGAMGLSMTPGETLALVACASDDAVAIVEIVGGRDIRQIGTIRLEPKSEPRDVVIAPDGRSAYVVRFGDGKLTRLAIRGKVVTRADDIAVGPNPDGAIIARDGRYLYNTGFGGTSFSGSIGAIAIVDLRAGRMVGGVTVGQTPEHVTLSPDGRFLATVVGNGSAGTRTAANFATVLGRLKLFRVDGATLTPAAETPIGHNCQGAVFSGDGHTLLVQCAVEKSITAYRFDGTSLVPEPGDPLTFDARPGAIATARSR